MKALLLSVLLALPAHASAFVQGCWRSHDGVVEVAFLDGDSVRIPTTAFRAPTAL